MKPMNDPILEGCKRLSRIAGPKTQKEIADACGVKLQSIQFIEYRALRKLRRPYFADELREYL